MDKATLRPYIFEILKRTPQTHFHAIENDLRRQLDSYERQDVLLLQEILWEMLVQGILAPGKNSLNLHLPFVHVTEYGARCLEDGRILVHDPEQYLERMRDQVGGELDECTVQSVREALGVFLAGHWAASVVLLARVAELLFDRIASAWPDDRHVAAEPCMRFSLEQARHVLDHLKQAALPEELASSMEPHLHGLLAILQLARGQDGSPRWPDVSRDQALGLFLLLPAQYAFVSRLTATGKSGPPG